jgi:hypothetical protein
MNSEASLVGCQDPFGGRPAPPDRSLPAFLLRPQRATVLPVHKNRLTCSQSRVARRQVEIQGSTVRAIRNGADVVIAETKSKVVILTPGRGFSRASR